ncbi:MAG: purine-binding chemotaxis protein CheW [Gammaproteobacteria bacterium]|nr:purine-binding chemotaxis protein CheW [Gammaproteobacteria bacterium]
MTSESTQVSRENDFIPADEDGQFLTFILGNEEYGVDILRVQEIKGWDKATPIPNTPDYIKGVINLRGTVVPIIDLRSCFNIGPTEYGKTTVIVVVKVLGAKGERTMGFVVDGVSDVYTVEKSKLKPAPDFGGNVSSDFIRGLVTVDEKMVILLDVDQLVNRGIEQAIEAGSVH